MYEFDHLIIAIAVHAATDYPRESCGYVANGAYYPCINAADDPLNAFDMSGDTGFTQALIDGTLQGVVHSHTDGPAFPTKRDLLNQINMGVPWGIAVTDGRAVKEVFWYGDQLPIPPLEKRKFRYGVTDCWTLIRHWYKLERGLWLPAFASEWGWWKAGEDIYRTGLAEAGFRRLTADERPVVGDMCSMRIDSSVPNHGGLYIGNGQMLHHLMDQYSRADSIERYMAIIKDNWYRHEST